eukprot:1463619-Amphidinium_carterae.2
MSWPSYLIARWTRRTMGRKSEDDEEDEEEEGEEEEEEGEESEESGSHSSCSWEPNLKSRKKRITTDGPKEILSGKELEDERAFDLSFWAQHGAMAASSSEDEAFEVVA